MSIVNKDSQGNDLFKNGLANVVDAMIHIHGRLLTEYDAKDAAHWAQALYHLELVRRSSMEPEPCPIDMPIGAEP